MSKAEKEVLKDIDKLCGEIDKLTSEIVRARCMRDMDRISVAHWAMESILVAVYQELDFLGNYIEDNIKEK